MSLRSARFIARRTTVHDDVPLPRAERREPRTLPSALLFALVALLALAAPAVVRAQRVAKDATAAAPRLSGTERRIADWVTQHREDQVAMLQRVVDIPSGTFNVAGVRQVGDVFRAALDSLGFQTRWIAMPDSMRRAGHLFAEHVGKSGRARILLIGHFDTVFEGPGQGFVREDTIARGAGTSDMKGGDVVILYALRALEAAGALKDANIIVAFSGDEEAAGDPLSISRRDLVAAGKRSDVALAFEGEEEGQAVVGRRGASEWVLRVTGRQGHSSGIFGPHASDGAIYETARILNDFRTAIPRDSNVTYNVGVLVGGERVSLDSATLQGTAAGKTNIIPPNAAAVGDLRFLSDDELRGTRTRMREIVARNLPGTSAEISFQDGYPAMTPKPGNFHALAVYDSVSRALGYGAVAPNDPSKRGAGDISFVAPDVPAGLDGLGVAGRGSHSPNELVFLSSLPVQTQRAALLIYRLSRQPSAVTP